jgi:hypothetical protein
MDMHRDLYTEALRRAAQTLGGDMQLARFLAVEPAQLDRWLAGDEPAPLSVFLSTLDVIADGPYAAPNRRGRVAAIRPEEEPSGRK